MKITNILIGLTLALGIGLVATANTGHSKKTDKIVLTSDNTLSLTTAIMPDTVGPFLLKAKELDEKMSNSLSERVGGKKHTLYLVLYSPGGSIQTGLEMIDYLKGLDRPISTITMFSASMAFQTVQSLGERLILSNGVLMSHRAAGGSEGSFGGQAPDQFSNRIGLWYTRVKELDELTVRRTEGKQTMASYTKAYADELWMTGAQAVDQGYADKVISVKCDKSLAGVETKEMSVMGGLLTVQFEMDRCPTNTNPMNIHVLMQTNQGFMSYTDFKAKSGDFGVSCLGLAVYDTHKLCATDPTITQAKIIDIESNFKQRLILNKDLIQTDRW